MTTATMDEIMRHRHPDLKQAVVESLEGEIGKAFEKLGSNVAELKPDNIAGAIANRWFALSPDARENTGVMAPSHELRPEINGNIRERLARDGRIHGPALQSDRTVSKGYMNAERALAGNCAVGGYRGGAFRGGVIRTFHVEGLDAGGSRPVWRKMLLCGRRGICRAAAMSRWDVPSNVARAIPDKSDTACVERNCGATRGICRVGSHQQHRGRNPVRADHPELLTGASHRVIGWGIRGGERTHLPYSQSQGPPRVRTRKA